MGIHYLNPYCVWKACVFRCCKNVKMNIISENDFVSENNLQFSIRLFVHFLHKFSHKIQIFGLVIVEHTKMTFVKFKSLHCISSDFYLISYYLMNRHYIKIRKTKFMFKVSIRKNLSYVLRFTFLNM